MKTLYQLNWRLSVAWLGKSLDVFILNRRRNPTKERSYYLDTRRGREKKVNLMGSLVVYLAWLYSQASRRNTSSWTPKFPDLCLCIGTRLTE